MELLDRLENRVDALLAMVKSLRTANARLLAEKEAINASLQHETAKAAALQEELAVLRQSQGQGALLVEENAKLRAEVARANDAKGVVALKIDRLLKKLSTQTL